MWAKKSYNYKCFCNFRYSRASDETTSAAMIVSLEDGGKGSLKDNLEVMFSGKVLFQPTTTFPQSHIIYADSILRAHEIIKQGGYFVVRNEDIHMFKASATPEIHFKTAAEGLTPVFSDLGFKSEKECKTFFAKDYRKLRISLGEDGKTTDWILMKQARRSKDMTSADDFMINEMALNGTVTTSCLPGQNDNYKKEKPAEGWRKERKIEREALQNSPAYIRGSLFTLRKKREPKGEQGGGVKAKKRKPKDRKGRCNMGEVMKEDSKDEVTAGCSFNVYKKAPAGTVITTNLPVQNQNYEVEKPAEGVSKKGKKLRKERKKLRKALMNAQASIQTSSKKMKSSEPKNKAKVVITKEREVSTGRLSSQPLRLRGGFAEMDEIDGFPVDQNRKVSETDEGEGPDDETETSREEVNSGMTDRSRRALPENIMLEANQEVIDPDREGEMANETREKFHDSVFMSRIELSSKFSLEVQKDMHAEGEDSREVHNPPNSDLDQSKTYGYRCLEKIDSHFVESPRLIVSGIWRGETLELVARRKPEGTLVEWTLTERRCKTRILLVKAQMTYKSRLRPSTKYGSMFKSYGYRVTGGWAWSGYGYGFVNVFPSSSKDQSIKHIDLEEAVFPNENQYHHVSGPACRLDKNTDVCNDAGCGVRIWSLSIKSYTTDVHQPHLADVKVHNKKRKEQKEHIWLSLVVFQSTGMHRMLLHRDGPDRTYRCVAWMTKVNDFFKDDPDVDQCILERHRYIWSTELPREIHQPDQATKKSGTIIMKEKNRDGRGEDELNSEEGEADNCKKRLRTQENQTITNVLHNINQIPIVHSQTERQGDRSSDPLYDLQRALRESRKTAVTSILQGEMVQQGIQVFARLGVNCQAHTSFIPPDGDCLWSCFARSTFISFHMVYLIEQFHHPQNDTINI